MSLTDPDYDCPRCARLVAFRMEQRHAAPDWFNAPVPTFGGRDVRLLIVGLAPGLKGANRTGRPFTGDYAGDLLYATLLQNGFARGVYDRRPEDGLELIDCAITNAVRCVPPQNKPTPAEISTCRDFLAATIEGLPNLRVVVALGRVSHESIVRACGQRVGGAPFAHGGKHSLATIGGRAFTLFNSYHCSRYNTNTRVLTEAMFHNVFAQVRAALDG